MTKELLQDIADSQMVLIGIGKEMEESYQGMKEDTFYKYEAKLESDTYEKLFIFCMLSPVSPADIMVMITGLTSMSLKRFTAIMVITKPLSIICYSYFWIYGSKLLEFLFHK